MGLEILSLHEYQFFPTIHVMHPLSDHLKGSWDMFGPDLAVLETQWDFKTQTL